MKLPKSPLLKTAQYFTIFTAIMLMAGCAFMKIHPVFGGSPDAQSRQRIEKSPNFNGKKFVNLQDTQVMVNKDGLGAFKSFVGWVGQTLNPPKGRVPSQPLPSIPLNINELKHGSIVWLGHATTLIQAGDKRILTDPVFYRASPVPIAGKPFLMTHTHTIAELSSLDVVLISHDHYDHLDYKAIVALDNKTAQFIVPLGVKGHLVRWGVNPQKIIELDWDESTQIGETKMTFVPSRHFSGRTFPPAKNQSLWGGYVIQAVDFSIYFSGDGGYGNHYKERIAKYAPFDLVLMENGAYDERWSEIHSFPEQSVQAVRDVGASRVMPMHWAKFDLANHAWTDSIERFIQSANPHNLTVATPKIGQVFNVFDKQLPNEKWWVGVEWFF